MAMSSKEAFSEAGFQTHVVRNNRDGSSSYLNLDEPDLPVKALAHRLGFTDDWTFTRAFRRHFGLLPSEVRAGAALAPAAASAESPLKPNRHIVPSGFPEDWIREYYPRPRV